MFMLASCVFMQSYLTKWKKTGIVDPFINSKRGNDLDKLLNSCVFYLLSDSFVCLFVCLFFCHKKNPHQ